MTKLFRVLLPLLMTSVCAAQGYMPVGGQKSQTPPATSALRVLPPGCRSSDIPTSDQLKTKKFQTHMQIMTAAQAASLNITFGGISSSYNADQLLAISDSSRVAPCLGTDGKTILYYGQAIRTIVAMNDYTVKGGASIAIVAATATANGKTNSVDLYEIGFGDAQLDSKLVSAKQTLGGSGIQIENYSEFIKAYAAAESYAINLTNPGIDLVAYEMPFTTSDYKEMLATAWAIQKIAEGRGCLDAIKDYRERDPQYENDIRNTYTQIASGCAVDAVGKAKAQQLLNGLRIRY